MISNASITPMLPVSDVSRATAFYRDKLGMQDMGEMPDGGQALRSAGGGEIGLLPAEPGAQSAHTVLTFEVDDIAGEVADLEERGVRFDDYDLPDFRTDPHHIATWGGEKAAWFHDSEGNILCLHAQRRDMPVTH